ncbi:hypothetical protein D5018_12140 [Parashewanella curva]|uniref:Uncharacterized protein n=1 Tax=Parashewanella curva TaxID=2338552 RepID=A0A3L8PVJ2_9GAMM|nr:hypothetical protein [Parashewanella curva]RLV59445.1 hypothetical protein D5018_12140 [Parashewanella curva]
MSSEMAAASAFTVYWSIANPQQRYKNLTAAALDTIAGTKNTQSSNTLRVKFQLGFIAEYENVSFGWDESGKLLKAWIGFWQFTKVGIMDAIVQDYNSQRPVILQSTLTNPESTVVPIATPVKTQLPIDAVTYKVSDEVFSEEDEIEQSTAVHDKYSSERDYSSVRVESEPDLTQMTLEEAVESMPRPAKPPRQRKATEDKP